MNSEPDGIPRKRGGGCGKVAAACVLLLLALVAGLYLYDAHLRRKLEARLAALRAEGQPVTFDEFMERRRRAAPVENSALVFLDAFESLRFVAQSEKSRDSTIALMRPPGELGVRRSDEQRRMLREHLVARGDALALIHEGAQLPPGAYPLDTSDPPPLMLMDYLTGVRGAARLSARAAVIHAEEGDGEAAAESVADGLALGASVGEWPLLIEMLVGLAADRLAQEALERVTALCELPAESLRQLRHLLKRARETSSVERGLWAARAGGHYLLVQASREELASLAELYGSGDERGLLARLYAALPVWRTGDALFYYDQMGRYIDLCSLPLPERASAAREANAQTGAAMSSNGWRHALSAMLLPGLRRSVEEDIQGKARLRVAFVALAVEEWRQRHAEWPESLEQLVPDVLPELPADPFTGGPLHYVRTDDGVLVYSVGQDGENNKGVSERDAPAPVGSGPVPYDVPFRLLDPERRGARVTTFRDEIMGQDNVGLRELGGFGLDEERLGELGFSAEDIRTLRQRN